VTGVVGSFSAGEVFETCSDSLMPDQCAATRKIVPERFRVSLAWWPALVSAGGEFSLSSTGSVGLFFFFKSRTTKSPSAEVIEAVRLCMLLLLMLCGLPGANGVDGRDEDVEDTELLKSSSLPSSPPAGFFSGEPFLFLPKPKCSFNISAPEGRRSSLSGFFEKSPRSASTSPGVRGVPGVAGGE